MTTILDLVTIVAPFVAVLSALLILWAVNTRGELVDYLGEHVSAARSKTPISNQLPLASERRRSENDRDDSLLAIRLFRRQRVAMKAISCVEHQEI